MGTWALKICSIWIQYRVWLAGNHGSATWCDGRGCKVLLGTIRVMFHWSNCKLFGINNDDTLIVGLKAAIEVLATGLVIFWLVVHTGQLKIVKAV